MTSSLPGDEGGSPNELNQPVPLLPPELKTHLPAKTGRILDQEFGTYGLEYDNTQGKRHTMRLDALTYERAIREAKSFLGINGENRDEHGTLWEIE